MHRVQRADVLPDDAVWATAQRFCLDGISPPHSHEFLELAIVLGGSGVHLSSSGEHPLAAGSAVVVAPGGWHCYERCDRLEVLNIYVGQGLLSGELARLLDGPAGEGQSGNWAQLGTCVGALAPEAMAEVAGSLQRLQEPSVPRLARTGYLLVVVGTLFASLGYARAGPPAPARNPRQGFHPAVRAALQHMEAAPERAWSLRDLAKAAAVSPAYLSRLFRRDLGLPPMHYLARLRAERAAALLLASDRPVAAVGRAVGWHDPNYLSRRFKHFFSLPPSAYRASRSGASAPPRPLQGTST